MYYWRSAYRAARADGGAALSPRKIFGYEQDLREAGRHVASRPRWVSRDVDGQAGIKHRPALASNGPENRRKKKAC